MANQCVVPEHNMFKTNSNNPLYTTKYNAYHSSLQAVSPWRWARRFPNWTFPFVIQGDAGMGDGLLGGYK